MGNKITALSDGEIDDELLDHRRKFLPPIKDPDLIRLSLYFEKAIQMLEKKIARWNARKELTRKASMNYAMAKKTGLSMMKGTGIIVFDSDHDRCFICTDFYGMAKRDTKMRHQFDRAGTVAVIGEHHDFEIALNEWMRKPDLSAARRLNDAASIKRRTGGGLTDSRFDIDYPKPPPLVEKHFRMEALLNKIAPKSQFEAKDASRKRLGFVKHEKGARPQSPGGAALLEMPVALIDLFSTSDSPDSRPVSRELHVPDHARKRMESDFFEKKPESDGHKHHHHHHHKHGSDGGKSDAASSNDPWKRKLPDYHQKASIHFQAPVFRVALIYGIVSGTLCI